MKRSIICIVCAARHRKLFELPPFNKGFKEITKKLHRDEFIKYVAGEALDDYVCDDCNSPLAADSIIFAVSMYTTRYYYISWEGNYLNRLENGLPYDLEGEIKRALTKIYNAVVGVQEVGKEQSDG